MLNIPAGLVLRKTVLYRGYAHICCIGSNEHLPQKEAATRTGIAALLFLRLIPVYALEGYWTARVRGDFESLVTCGFRFGNEDSGSAGQRKGGRERFVLSHPSAQNAEGCGIHGFPIRRVGHPHILL